MRNRDDLASFWMPFTSNKAFKAKPRIIDRADGFYFYDKEGREVIDGFSGMWCCHLGHNHPKLVEALVNQAKHLDYSPAFNFAHEGAIELSNVLADQYPDGLDHVFYGNSGSEAVETALKMAIAYHRIRGEGSRTRLIGRVNGYHGTGFGGITIGGMVNNRKFFGSLLPGGDHLSLPYDATTQAFTRGEPEVDVEPYMKELEGIIALHDASNIAAVIIEPFAGSGGVFIPPKGYLQRVREITEKHGILLIVDEVISAFGRIGGVNASHTTGVKPDIVTLAKGINSAAVPMGAVVASSEIYNAFMDGTPHGVEFFHGYTYASHPLAMATGLAAQEVYYEEGIYENVAAMSPYLEEAVHSLKGERHVTDIRNIGMAAGLTLETRDNIPGARALDVFVKAWELGAVIRNNGETLAIAPIMSMGKAEIDRIVDVVRQALNAVD